MSCVSTGSTTMDLLPMIEKSGELVQKSMNLFPQGGMKAESEPEKAQMTIFYGGQVIVFNDFPADKAKEIMLMASTSKGNNPAKPLESAADLVVPSFGKTSIQENQMPNQPIVSGNSFPLLSLCPCLFLFRLLFMRFSSLQIYLLREELH